jgi:hypothetical protein
MFYPSCRGMSRFARRDRFWICDHGALPPRLKNRVLFSESEKTVGLTDLLGERLDCGS